MDVSTIAAKAAGYRPARALLTLVAVPFWLAGMVAAVVWIAATWCWAAGVQGFADANARVRSETASDGEV